MEKMNEFELASRAKTGDKKAVEILWNRYKTVSSSILWCVAHMEKEELESEAFMLFMHKLDLFDPKKIGQTEENWSFSFMITGGMKNLRNKLINQNRKYCEEVKTSYEESEEEGVNQWGANKALFGLHVYDRYNTEEIIIRSEEESTERRVKNLYAKLSVFEKVVLEKRRAGLKLQEIADELGCSLSKVKSHLKIAKQVASRVFEVSYA
ncbi:MAG: RNA polymerase sigma factor [Bacteroidales bacterium]